MARALLLAAAVLVGCTSAPPPDRDPTATGPPSADALLAAPALSPRNANYSIDVALDPSRHLLTGREVITWRNVTAAGTSELRLHLYFNAWKHSRTTWLEERTLGGRHLSLLERPADDWAYCELSAVRLVGHGGAPPLDLLRETRPIAPDDGNALDETLVSVALPQPVGPGETVNLEVEWTSKVPRTFARTGRVGRFYFLAQWFPKIGVLEDEGWRAHQFHAGTEFYADYGIYDVRLRVPDTWVVGATGREVFRRDNGDGTSTHHYVQTDVHDFAWTTSPDYRVLSERFEHESLPPVEMRLLLQPEHASQAARHFAATRAALKFYGEWYGAYPYGHVTIVDPAWQSGAGGMEYPTLFTAGTDWLAPRLVTTPESVTVHEAGHQFWYGIVGNNEFEHAWLDEGLNQFSEARTLSAAGLPNFYSRRFFGGFVPWVYRDLPQTREVDGNLLNWYRDAAESDAQATPSFRYHPATGGTITYAKTALWLNTLERHLGWPTLQRIMSTFFERWKFRHPKPADFFAAAREASGQDLAWFFDEVHRGSNVFDYAIDSLESRTVPRRGYTSASGAPAFVDQATPTGRYETRLVVRREGEARFPVDVRVTFADGSVRRERWDGVDRWRTFVLLTEAEAVSAQVDPDRVLLLDVNATNNSVTLTPRSAEAATKWALVWMAWLQDALLTWSLLV